MENILNQFTVYPAIDLRHGCVVRLIHGEKNSQKTYSQNPADAAKKWINAGAEWLHVINLDGAFGEKGIHNIKALENIISAAKAASTPVNVQFGGGLRSLIDIQHVIKLGVSRVILGTSAVKSPEIVSGALEHYGAGQVALALDSRKNRVRIHGWEKESEIDPISLGERMYRMGVRSCIFTNIEKDGTMSGVDLEGTKEYADKTGLSVIASGGISTLEEVQAVKNSGLSGVIIGKALYEGKIQLEEAVAC